MPPAADLLGNLLRQVSRSFYLSLRILPSPLREPISLAYLLARAADTVADTKVIARADRIMYLETLRDAYAGRAATARGVVEACQPHQDHERDRHLLAHVDDALAGVRSLPAADRDHVRAVLATLTSGMIFDLTRFPGEDATNLAALDTIEELDHYTYLVAGCVGPFWTALHVAHRPRLAPWDLARMSEDGVRFGRALQTTNVLRDVPRDLQNGRCYLPARELAALGLTPLDLLDPSKRPRAWPLVERLLVRSLDHYDVAWRYTFAIPRAEWRMRLACAWPLLIGLATLRALADHPDPLGATTPIKISRSEVRMIIVRSLLSVWSNRALARHARRLTASLCANFPLALAAVRRAP